MILFWKKNVQPIQPLFGTFFKISNGTRQKDRKLQTRPTGFEQRPRKPRACGHWRDQAAKQTGLVLSYSHIAKKNILKIKMETNTTLSAFSHLWTQKPNHNLPQQPPNPVEPLPFTHLQLTETAAEQDTSECRPSQKKIACASFFLLATAWVSAGPPFSQQYQGENVTVLLRLGTGKDSHNFTCTSVLSNQLHVGQKMEQRHIM